MPDRISTKRTSLVFPVFPYRDSKLKKTNDSNEVQLKLKNIVGNAIEYNSFTQLCAPIFPYLSLLFYLNMLPSAFVNFTRRYIFEKLSNPAKSAPELGDPLISIILLLVEQGSRPSYKADYIRSVRAFRKCTNVWHI